ncbi:hypothetical protein [Streptomyces sp. NPDC001307]
MFIKIKSLAAVALLTTAAGGIGTVGAFSARGHSRPCEDRGLQC